MMCERATDLIQELAAAVAAGMSVGELLQVIHGHPTFTEVIVAALEALQKKL
jgi:dihydrolipoamide dehydrogenase